MPTATRGRPPASSREVLADAACELFLEQGYDATSVTEITRRAGVSRSSFFNYFATKAAILWFVFDDHIDELEQSLRDPDVAIGDALQAFGSGGAPHTLALAIVDARTMGVEAELGTGRATRQLRIGDMIAARFKRAGEPPVRAEILAAGCAAAVVGAVWRWAEQGAGRTPLADVLADALEEARAVVRG